MLLAFYLCKNYLSIAMQENSCLYHFPICPFCRKIRVMLEATGAIKNCSLRIENFWEKREKFISINPTGNVPLMIVQKIDENENKHNTIIWGQNTIIEYLRNKYPASSLLSGNNEDYANVIKYGEWFDTNFYRDVVGPILEERVYVVYKKKRLPNVDVIKVARRNLEQYIVVFEKLLQGHDFIANNEFSFADVVLSSHISSLDYLGEINWQNYPIFKEWYLIIKSKLIFRDLLYDILPNIRQSENYRELDF